MRAVRELVGGVALAVLAAVTVIGGLLLAVTEGGLGAVATPTPSVPTRVIAAVSPSALPATLASSLPSNTPPPTSTEPASPAPTEAATATLQPTQAPATDTPQPAPTDTPAPAATETASPAPSQTPEPPTATDTPAAAETPTRCAPPAAWVPYTVVPGDTLFQLALRYGLNTFQLQQANCLPAADIKYGQVLYVPFAPSATPTATIVPSATPIPLPLRINGISVAGVTSDPSRPNGAIATLYIDLSGGTAPYTILNDGSPVSGNPFNVLTICGGTVNHTFKVVSADGQSAQQVFFQTVQCP